MAIMAGAGQAEGRSQWLHRVSTWSVGPRAPEPSCTAGPGAPGGSWPGSAAAGTWLCLWGAVLQTVASPLSCCVRAGSEVEVLHHQRPVHVLSQEPLPDLLGRPLCRARSAPTPVCHLSCPWIRRVGHADEVLCCGQLAGAWGAAMAAWLSGCWFLPRGGEVWSATEQ